MLGIALTAVFLVNISLGAVKIPLYYVLQSLTGGEVSKTSWQYIIINYRLPKAITAVLTGMGLSIGGLMMQTLFRNPLAGPDVLGLNSGAGLGVAFVILASGMLPNTLSVLFISPYGVALAAILGSFTVLITVLTVARRIRDTMSILIVGLMFSSFAGAIVGVLTYFSTAEHLQKYTFWGLGSLGNLSWDTIILLTVIIAVGIALAAFTIKPLDALLLGERYAQSLGINFKRIQFIIIIATSLLTGCITAFAGPIVFVGLVVPHIAKLIFKTGSHKILFCATLFTGALLMLLCDILTQLPGTSFVLPINAITSIIGAPVVVALVMRKRKGIF